MTQTLPANWIAVFSNKYTVSESGCWIWKMYTDKLGYGRIGSSATKQVKTHRASYELAFGQIPDGIVVMHSCDVRNCINPYHLSVGSQADNVADMVAKGRLVPCPPKFGSENPISKLDEENVWAIRAFLKHKIHSQKAIAESYGVSEMTISRIANGKTWKHVHENWPYYEVA